MRTLLRGALKKSLAALGEEDRMAAAWTVVCGRALSERGAIVGYANGEVEVEVVDALWLQHMTAMRQQLVRELGAIADVPVRGIRFVVRGAADGRKQRGDSSRGGDRGE